MSKANEIIRKLKNFREMAPVLYRMELPLENLSEVANISQSAYNRTYEKVGSVNGLDIIKNKQTNAIIAGTWATEDKFTGLIAVENKELSEEIPLNLPSTLNAYRVGLVRVKKNNVGEGLAKSLYITLINSGIDLVSDTEQFLGGYWLWKSLVKESVKNSKFNIYIYNGNTDDYFKDNLGKPIKYNGSNIAEDEIWGKSDYHEKIVLVATSKQLR